MKQQEQHELRSEMKVLRDKIRVAVGADQQVIKNTRKDTLEFWHQNQLLEDCGSVISGLHRMWIIARPPNEVASTRIGRIDGGEWVVRAYNNEGARLPEADYFTDDHQDALDTQKAMARGGAK